MSNSKLHGNRRLRWSSKRKVKNTASPPQTRLLFPPVRNRLKASEGSLFVESMHCSLSKMNSRCTPNTTCLDQSPKSEAEIGGSAFQIKCAQITGKVLVCSDREKEFDLLTASAGCLLVRWDLKRFHRCERPPDSVRVSSLVSPAPLVYDKTDPRMGQ